MIVMLESEKPPHSSFHASLTVIPRVPHRHSRVGGKPQGGVMGLSLFTLAPVSGTGTGFGSLLSRETGNMVGVVLLSHPTLWILP